MPAATHADYRSILDGVGALYECENLEDFQRVAREQISRLVGSDHVTFSYLAPTIPKAAVAGWPGLRAENETREKTFARHLSEHPALKHYFATGDPSAHKISDFLSVDQYHALELYEQLYRDLQCEDQFVFMLFPPGSELISLGVTRSRRTFTERDRQILNLFRPSLAQAYRFVDRLGRATRRIGEIETRPLHTRVTAVVLDGKGHPVRFWSEARNWLGRFFYRQRTSLSGLPENVAAWLRRKRRTGTLNNWGGKHTLLRERDGQRLRLRLMQGLQNSQCILVLGLHSSPGGVDGGGAKTLTRREVEIMRQVELGKSNDEVSVALGISSLTVRKHLENIFHKLQVPSRTAAVTRLRQACVELGAEFCGLLSLMNGALDNLWEALT